MTTPYFKDLQRMPPASRVKWHAEKERRIAELKEAGFSTHDAIVLGEQETFQQMDSVDLGKFKVEGYMLCPHCSGRIAMRLIAGQVVADKD